MREGLRVVVHWKCVSPFFLKEEFFFDNVVKMTSFEQFEVGFVFQLPNRVDLLVKSVE